jgi:serine/threonine protein kinase
MLEALEFLHSKEVNIIHRQVRADNILYNDVDHFVLADFGIAGGATPPSDQSTLFHEFMAPEMYKAEQHTTPLSIFGV